ncbi:MAG TPA: hypothetical protein VFB12_27760 [Ktedonobacteraceae bacterium]|nr:hypothetical protein [Ktedonobacteraceae bacterium]
MFGRKYRAESPLSASSDRRFGFELDPFSLMLAKERLRHRHTILQHRVTYALAEI